MIAPRLTPTATPSMRASGERVISPFSTSRPAMSPVAISPVWAPLRLSAGAPAPSRASRRSRSSGESAWRRASRSSVIDWPCGGKLPPRRTVAAVAGTGPAGRRVLWLTEPGPGRARSPDCRRRGRGAAGCRGRDEGRFARQASDGPHTPANPCCCRGCRCRDDSCSAPRSVWRKEPGCAVTTGPCRLYWIGRLERKSKGKFCRTCSRLPHRRLIPARCG